MRERRIKARRKDKGKNKKEKDKSKKAGNRRFHEHEPPFDKLTALSRLRLSSAEVKSKGEHERVLLGADLDDHLRLDRRLSAERGDSDRRSSMLTALAPELNQ